MSANLEEKITILEETLKKTPDNLELLVKLGALYSQTNCEQAALKKFHEALQLDPGSLAVHYHLGMHFMRYEHYEYAILQFKNVLALDENTLPALFHLGVCFFHKKDYEDAKYYFEKVVEKQPEDVESWVNLGAIAMAQDEGQLAISHFTKALTFNPDHEAARSNLAAAFLHFNRYENALTHYLILLEQFPDHLEYQYQAAVSEMTLGQLAQAKSRFMMLLKREPNHFSVLYNLALISIKLEEYSDAKRYLIRAREIEPKDPSSQHLYAALVGEKSSAKISALHAQRLFEQYALYYDQHMLHSLRYQLPFHIFKLLQKHKKHHLERILDLGCGTGLVGEILKPVSAQRVGVDLSASMLKRAEEKGCYTECVESEALLFLQQTSFKFDLIVAADLFPYLGELLPYFEAMKRCLMPGGEIIFSVEVAIVKPWTLKETARYAHHIDYVKDTCEQVGLVILDYEQVVARQQNGQDVLVWLILAGKYVVASESEAI